MNNYPAAVSDLPETPVDSEDSALLYFSFSLLYFYYNITIILDSNNNNEIIITSERSERSSYQY